MSDTLVEAEHLAKHFDLPLPPAPFRLSRLPRPRVSAVDDVSFRIARGATLSLVGESGCGKTTLARMAVGLLQPSAGAIRFENRDLTRRDRAVRRRINMVFQNPSRNGWQSCWSRSGCPFATARFPHEFSGGQRQRIAIARALSNNPAFLACDEPTSALDVSAQAQVLNLMRDLQRRLGLTYLFISHNLAVVRHMSDVLAVMYLGRVVETGPSEDVFRAPRHPYTRLLLDAVPDVSRIGRPSAVLPGEPPSSLAPPPGCVFHPRCPLANERCRRERPTETVTGAVRVACHAIAEGRAGG